MNLTTNEIIDIQSGLLGLKEDTFIQAFCNILDMKHWEIADLAAFKDMELSWELACYIERNTQDYIHIEGLYYSRTEVEFLLANIRDTEAFGGNYEE